MVFEVGYFLSCLVGILREICLRFLPFRGQINWREYGAEKGDESLDIGVDWIAEVKLEHCLEGGGILRTDCLD